MRDKKSSTNIETSGGSSDEIAHIIARAEIETAPSRLLLCHYVFIILHKAMGWGVWKHDRPAHGVDRIFK